MIFSSNYTWVGFITVFNFYTILLSSLYIYTFSLSNQLFYGDFVAYKKMKAESLFVQINNIYHLGLNDKNIPITFYVGKREKAKNVNKGKSDSTHNDAHNAS